MELSLATSIFEPLIMSIYEYFSILDHYTQSPTWPDLERSIILTNDIPQGDIQFVIVLFALFYGTFLKIEHNDKNAIINYYEFLFRTGLEDPSQLALIRSMELSVGNVSDYKTAHNKVCEIPFTIGNKYYVSNIFIALQTLLSYNT